jgi:hydrogenase maturation protease
MTKTLVIGLGNPLLGDDGVGWHVAEGVRQALMGASRPTEGEGRRTDEPLPSPYRGGEGEGSVPHPPSFVEVDCHVGGGLSLMERLVGYDRAIVIDAVNLGQGPVGHVTCFPLEALPHPSVGHLTSAHETNLWTALQVGRTMGAHLPAQVMVVAVESPYVYEFSDKLTPPVAAAVPQAVQKVLELLGQEEEP